MSSRNILPSRPRSASVISNRSGSATEQTSIDETIHRIGIAQGAKLGSFYDARNGSIVGQLSLDNKLIIKKPLHTPVECTIMENNLLTHRDLFENTGIPEETWLDCMLNTVSTENITGIINYPFSRDGNIRYIYFYYASNEKSIKPDQNVVKSTIAKEIPDVTATHVISSMKLGIQTLIILQLPIQNECELDDLLQKKTEQLVKNKLQILVDEQILLDRVTVVKIFSNILDHCKMSKLVDICQNLSNIKSHPHCHCPLEYTLRPIRWFYPSYSKQKAQYIPLKENTIKTFKEYLFSLSTQIKDLKTSSDLEEYLDSEKDVIRKQIREIEQMYLTKIDGIRELVSNIRCGKEKQELVHETWIRTSKNTSQKKIDSAINYRESFRNIKDLLSQPNNNHVQYPAPQQDCIEHENDTASVVKKLHTKNKQKSEDRSMDNQINQNSTIKSDQQNELKSENSLSPQHSPQIEKNSTETESLRCMSTPTSKPMIPLKQTSTFKSMNVPFLPFIAGDLKRNHQSSTRRESFVAATPLKTTITQTILQSNEQLDSSTNSDNKSKSSSQSTLDVSQSSKKQIRSSSLSNTNRTTLKEEQFVEPNGHSEVSRTHSPRPVTDVSVKTSKQHDENHELINSSFSSEKSDRENILNRQVPIPSPRTRSLSTTKRPNSSNSMNSSTKETRALVHKSANDNKDLDSISNKPRLSPSTTISRTNKETTNTKEPLKTSVAEGSTLLNNTNNQEFTSKLSPSVLSKIPKIADESTSQDTQNHFNQSKTEELLSTEHTVIQSPRPSTPTSTSRERRRTSRQRFPTVNYINILLLGESGVGKSTFINALANYKAFATFQQAYSSKPLVVMPVSFLITIGDNFEEKTVKFGDIDDNEDHDHPGQSVTQYCRSYIFPIDSQTKLRLIDTPGMGDTRGLEQDDQNMQHILSFISNLSHLNAICILLKPNESRLNIVLRSYFNRLLNFLGENARHNIVFCFTNTRATFFAPGNTGPLLKKMIESSSIGDIPFQKTNTFCFDSESFRYLVALQNGIDFDDYQQTEYRQSWIASVTESNRFLEYICQGLAPFLQNDWQSIEHAQFKITQITRPLIETMRNIVRNINLSRATSPNLLIKLCPSVLTQQSAICYKCPRIPERFNDFWILPDEVHNFSNKCNDCKCSIRKHIVVSYKLDYEFAECEGEQFFKRIRSNLDELRMAMLVFGKFFADTSDIQQKKDPLSTTLKRIIDEEKQICSERDSNYLNSTLHNVLTGFLKEYKEMQTTSIDMRVPLDLLPIYEQIASISEIDEVKKQMQAIKQAQLQYLIQYEKEVS